MPGPLSLLTHTPLWVWALLALLVAAGVLSLRPRTVSPVRLLITPSVFILWGIYALLARPGFAPLLFADWLGTALIGGGLAAWLTRFDGYQAAADGRISVPGSAMPLLRSLAIFAAKYGLTAAAIIAPAQKAALAPWDIAVSGLSAGYFLGWALRFARFYRTHRAPAALPQRG
jgi:hypothetical protein